MLRTALLETPRGEAEQHAQARMREMHDLIDRLKADAAFAKLDFARLLEAATFTGRAPDDDARVAGGSTRSEPAAAIANVITPAASATTDFIPEPRGGREQQNRAGRVAPADRAARRL